MGGGVNYPTLIRIQHYCTQIFHNQKERTQKNLNLLSKLYCRPLKGIEVNWHTYREKRQLLNKTWTSRPFPSLENKNSGFPFVPSLLLGVQIKIASTFCYFSGQRGNLFPQTMAPGKWQNACHVLLQRVVAWCGAISFGSPKEFVQSSWSSFDDLMIQHFSFKSSYTSNINIPVFYLVLDPSIWSFIVRTTSSECWPGMIESLLFKLHV